MFEGHELIRPEGRIVFAEDRFESVDQLGGSWFLHAFERVAKVASADRRAHIALAVPRWATG